MSLRERILAAADDRYEDVEVPQWGVTVRVRALPGSEMEAWADAHIDEAGKPRPAKERMFRMFLACVVDPETNAPLFSAEDLPELRKKSAAAVSQLAGVALALNGGKAKN